MNHDELRHWSRRAADWAADYHAGLRQRPVRPPVQPGTVAAALPETAPEAPEPMERIFEDFERIVPDAMTHWQHPRFFAYFPANAAPASMLAEQLVNAMACQAMLWQTSPAATEIEMAMMRWLREALGLPSGFTGTIHDSATTATLSAVLTMRERALDWAGVEQGLSGQPRLRLYASAETHSSVDKAVRIAGIGQENLVKVPTDHDHAMRPGALAGAIAADKAAGFVPAGVILCAGGTSIGAFDRIGDCIAVARAHDLMTHVDAAWAGSAMICPEFRPLWQGVEAADSIVFNPHKWLGAQFDCAVQFLADPGPQVRTLGLNPAYLVTAEGGVPDYNAWTVPLGRRFRALKLWFLLRAYGLDGLRARIRNHVAWAAEAARAIADIPGCEVVTGPSLSLFTFAAGDDAATEALLKRIEADGRIFLSPTRHEGRSLIRVQVGQFDCTAEDVAMIPRVVAELIRT
ncbi:aspartate aminotransferase family protein [Cereibacter sphaeroides]|uniref:pyridoxal phosphate-dependent decarboxylase family protein n=1 Tax=Cereibacter sphaeroides TaxID=1063 RepID=UPI001F4847DB|nr:pyridoxal-dependent decarboxylase [Cereibacter sphaeroides]MCE6953178.1 aspartate aminotransferase family protein [Cereibacter sphaeroides]MCE6961721.1 aspartate aminotransferase family protein [Cereibacter sphaeroides]MCE6970497.1 aspartate aminotransferase family protein [Cereibacter sphaeroides]MCE6975071.1 aspartate aminotransferase family protein [Cereibacter sphaeroides]